MNTPQKGCISHDEAGRGRELWKCDESVVISRHSALFMEHSALLMPVLRMKIHRLDAGNEQQRCFEVLEG
ncbi:uncharacterized protein LACBIDRAFT_315242 [Laccaria bicolor S238N-H82]|uniref:Predicted protein n=1 Tax=Laccaria bicolor (strain S238N-H82 / ATCC MYA-4686) TaxID=486041 RepID=B0E056_LACBS|nr:uncharacterized protein LACBIDRAFT_315242 [Laccaria bicolor S238N-H82]EDQ99762.1 predicted protein [Laccaria bicolor S238N-H82]|eukprot:XP_001889598.1 predicted protein [Laccaria bicolor S238N-H82]